MPQTTAERSAAVRRAAETRRRRAAHTEPHREPGATVERTTELSDEVLRSLESGQRAAIEAVRKFADTVDRALPAIGDRPTRREEIVDAALEMADRLVHTQYEFLRKVVQSAGQTLAKPGDGA